MTRVLSLIEMIEAFEEKFPGHDWLVTRRGLLYRASSNPIGYEAKVPGSNPDIISSMGETMEDAFEAMMLRTARRYNKDT